MTINYDASHRGWSQGSTHGAVCLQDKFEVLKEIGDGSFGSVALARVRTAGAHVARRGTLVAIKTMKKTFESFQPCLELREIIFLRTLPRHIHLVPALDIFLDPLSKKLHIAMEYMDGNLYQLMKARDHKPFDGASVKSILFQILSGLEHIHDNRFFHRDIKPENVLVSVSGREDLGSAFKRYSQLVTPPSTPGSFSIKLADFGLARETHSRVPYTTYVSTRWYRAPEVLLRAGEYSAPVDIWAVGAMAVEIATLKPLFPGGNEVDQVWRVCEIMGSPGNWVNKQGQKVGGGEWRDGVKLANKLGFSFPKMAPHTLDTIIQPPQWPPALSNFVTWCLMWDPKARPTSAQSMSHEYFCDAVDPLRPKSSGSRLLGRKTPDSSSGQSQPVGGNALSTKTSSWFRKSLVARESAPAIPQVHQIQHQQQQQQQRPPQVPQALSPQMSPIRPAPTQAPPNPRPAANKRNTWTNGAYPSAAPMPILPSIRPISPLSNAVTAEAHSGPEQTDSPKKIGRQLSVASHGNHYSDAHRQEAERALNGQSGVMSPSTLQKESFFSHLRKRARRLSGRHQSPMSPRDKAMADNDSTWVGNNSNRASLNNIMNPQDPSTTPAFAELDRALQNVRDSVGNTASGNPSAQHTPMRTPQKVSSNPMLKRQHSLQKPQPSHDSHKSAPMAPAFSATRNSRRAAQKPNLSSNTYDAPDEQDELLDEALASAHAAASHMDRQQVPSGRPNQDLPAIQEGAQRYPAYANNASSIVPYPTPSPSAKRNSVIFGNNGQSVGSQAININQNSKQQLQQHHLNNGYAFPTPPYEENEWAAAAAASIAAAGDHWR
ncbi:MAG: hypothetical protein M1828_006497 [Chrysothrix sp. TS-e1954]|nr:MAG: hypothetical protein M1828_006497 [Chrysothrix sp. TS-e1954]